jgi:hypothetical protein
MRSSITFILFLVTVQANAASVVTEFDFISGSGSAGDYSTTWMGWGYRDPIDDTVIDVMFNVEIGESDIGQVYSLTPGESGFYGLQQMLTNGVDDLMFYGDNIEPGDLGNGWWESALFGTTPDFSGLTITRLDMIVNDLSIVSDGSWTDVTLDATYVVHATTVPIPAAIWLFGSGLGLLGWFRRRQLA